MKYSIKKVNREENTMEKMFGPARAALFTHHPQSLLLFMVLTAGKLLSLFIHNSLKGFTLKASYCERLRPLSRWSVVLMFQ